MLSAETLIVTGGCSGLGEATVRRLHQEGANVAIFDRSVEQGEALVQELGARAFFQEVDVTEQLEVLAGVNNVVSHFAQLTGVVNCAGLGAVGLTVNRAGQALDPASFNFVIKVNLVCHPTALSDPLPTVCALPPPPLHCH